MSFADCMRSALVALRVNLLRSILTMLGIIIGVGAVITMVSLGAGASQQVSDTIQSLGANLIMVRPGSVTAGGVRMGGGSRLSLTEEDADAILREVSSIAAVAAQVDGGAQVIAGNQNWATQVVGTTEGYLVVRNWEIGEGRAFTVAEARGSGKLALIGGTVATQLFPDQSAVGQVLRINRVPFTVIGVLREKGQSFFGRDQDDFVMVPLHTAKQRVFGSNRFKGDAVEMIMVQVRDAALIGIAEQDMTNLLRLRHGIPPGGTDDFRVRNLAEFAQAREQSSRVLTFLLAAVASVSLLVGGIGIMNIMLVSVSERTREIGVRMAVGATPRAIRTQFLVESATLSVLGGLIGVLVGVGGAAGLALAAEWPVLVEVRAILIAFVFAGGVGIFFGYYPAHKAAHLNPIEALRHE